MDAIWIGPDGYIPGLGFHQHGDTIQIADDEWARALEKEGKVKIVEQPRAQKHGRRSGGE